MQIDIYIFEHLGGRCAYYVDAVASETNKSTRSLHIVLYVTKVISNLTRITRSCYKCYVLLALTLCIVDSTLTQNYTPQNISVDMALHFARNC